VYSGDVHLHIGLYYVCNCMISVRRSVGLLFFRCAQKIQEQTDDIVIMPLLLSETSYKPWALTPFLGPGVRFSSRDAWGT
jgi:hypothetical protein